MHPGRIHIQQRMRSSRMPRSACIGIRVVLDFCWDPTVLEVETFQSYEHSKKGLDAYLRSLS